MPIDSLLKKSFWVLATGVFAYLLSILALTIPAIQRGVVYAHKVNPSYWQNLSDVEQFGFIHHQVQPFTLTTPDKVTLYCWHILPLHLFYQHEEEITAQTDFGVKDFFEATSTKAFELLKSDLNAHVVLNFHGNAAHLASSHRPTTYNIQLGLSSPERPVHVIAFDYRGFGLSTGTPTEEGLIRDAEEILASLTGLTPVSPKSEHISVIPIVPARHIILFGQSLGTAVSTAVYHRWTITHELPAPEALILTSGFTSLPQLMDGYSLKGIVPPLLSPLNRYPALKAWIISHIADRWQTSTRIAELVAQVPTLDLTLIHAADDYEIPWREGWGNWLSAMGAVRLMKERTGHGGYYLMAEGDQEKIRTGRYPGDVLWTDGEERFVQWERSPRGGHNRLAAGNRAGLAVQRVLEGRK